MTEPAVPPKVDYYVLDVPVVLPLVARTGFPSHGALPYDEWCDHDSSSGTSESGTWRCDGCGQVWREVDDPQGDWTRFEHGNPEPRQFRREIIVSALKPTEKH